MERHPALVIPANDVQEAPPFLPTDGMRYFAKRSAYKAQQAFVEHESPLSAVVYAAATLNALQLDLIDEGFGYPEMWVSGEVRWIGQAPFVAVHNTAPEYQGGEWDSEKKCKTEWVGIDGHGVLTQPVE